MASLAGAGLGVPSSVQPSASASARTAVAAPERGRVVLTVHDTAGRRLDWRAFRRVQAAGHGEAGENDQLADPRTLAPIAAWPLERMGDGPGFAWPGRPAALTLAWPTSSQGYANLIVDVPGPGRYELTLLAARQAVEELRGTRSALASRARVLLARAERSRGAAGMWAARSLDAAHRATVAAWSKPRRGERVRGVTFDRVPASDAPYASVAALFGRGAWIRLVLDLDTTPADYAGAVARAHAHGLRVVGELLDSSDAAKVPLAAFRTRVATFVGGLPDMDAWEVGNEVNQRDLGPDGLAKLTFAARYVKEHAPRARTLLTLYWQLGEDDPQHSVFAWLAAHGDRLGDVDDVGLSVYPDQHPLGASLPRVLRTLAAQLPGKRLLISELGYATPEGDSTWWWASRRSPQAARRAVARFYQAASSRIGGGAFYWYFLDDAPRGGALWLTLRGAR